MKPVFFKTPAAFGKWLHDHHSSAAELLVGFYKTDSGKQSITWPESVNEALCYGWIDGVRKGLDEESYTIRFTPRKPTSIWSAVNIDKMEALLAKGLVQPAGLAAYEKRKESRSRVYSHEQKKEMILSEAYEKQFRAHKKAWAFFMDQAPSYRKVAIHIVMSAKQEKTRVSRLEKLIAASNEEKRMV